MIVAVSQIEAEVCKVWPNVLTPWMRRATNCFVMSDSFLTNEWNKWWWAFKQATGFKYEPGSGMCEEGAYMAVAWFMRCLRENHDFKNVDVTVGAWLLGIEIPRDESVNDVPGATNAGHLTVLAATTPDQRTIRKVIWEWQNEKWTEISEAAARGVVALDFGR